MELRFDGRTGVDLVCGIGTGRSVPGGTPALLAWAELWGDEEAIGSFLGVFLVLEDEIRTHMAPILDHVVARLALELHAGLEATVTQVVARAVAQELAHLHWNPA